MISNKNPDKMSIILKKKNATIGTENQGRVDIDTNIETDYLNPIKLNALCKMSKSLFFDHEISYCSNDDVNKFKKKK